MYVLSVLFLNIKTYTIALASDVQLIICRRFVIKEEKLKIQSYILLDGLVRRVSINTFMSPLWDICTRGFKKLNKWCI